MSAILKPITVNNNNNYNMTSISLYKNIANCLPLIEHTVANVGTWYTHVVIANQFTSSTISNAKLSSTKVEKSQACLHTYNYSLLCLGSVLHYIWWSYGLPTWQTCRVHKQNIYYRKSLNIPKL